LKAIKEAVKEEEIKGLESRLHDSFNKMDQLEVNILSK
jgi:hypothetical protein